MTVLVGICGKARSGKDTVADMICEQMEDDWQTNDGFHFVWTKSPMAGPLKQGIEGVFGKLPEDDEKEDNVPGFGFTWRKAMQTLGTEWGRSLDENIWTKLQQQRLDNLKELVDLFVVPDIRFDNEAQWLMDNGGFLIEVVRTSNDKVESHASEKGLMSIPDVVIYNNGSLLDLREMVKDTIPELYHE